MMKTTLILTLASLAIFSASCRTLTPFDPLTGEYAPEMLPEQVSPQKSDCPKKACASKCSCTKDEVTVEATK